MTVQSYFQKIVFASLLWINGFPFSHSESVFASAVGAGTGDNCEVNIKYGSDRRAKYLNAGREVFTKLIEYVEEKTGNDELSPIIRKIQSDIQRVLEKEKLLFPYSRDQLVKLKNVLSILSLERIDSDVSDLIASFYRFLCQQRDLQTGEQSSRKRKEPDSQDEDEGAVAPDAPDQGGYEISDSINWDDLFKTFPLPGQHDTPAPAPAPAPDAKFRPCFPSASYARLFNQPTIGADPDVVAQAIAKKKLQLALEEHLKVHRIWLDHFGQDKVIGWAVQNVAQINFLEGDTEIIRECLKKKISELRIQGNDNLFPYHYSYHLMLFSFYYLLKNQKSSTFDTWVNEITKFKTRYPELEKDPLIQRTYNAFDLVLKHFGYSKGEGGSAKRRRLLPTVPSAAATAYQQALSCAAGR